MPHQRLLGSIVALPTPFTDGTLDLGALSALIDLHAAARTDGIVVAGSTGEAHALTDIERRDLIASAVELSAGRLRVLAGTGTSDTRSTAAFTRFAAESGADGALVVAPPYARPSPRGLCAHFVAVAEAGGGLPIVLYNNPVRTGVDLAPGTVAAIVERAPDVTAIKEASGTLERLRALIGMGRLDVLVGEDPLIAAGVAAGAVGAVSVAGNLAPDLMADLIDAARDPRETDRRTALEARLKPLLELCALDANPVPVKAALAELGLCPAGVRGPLLELEPDSAARLRARMAEARLSAAPAL